jgi:uncharacterized membrane protein
VTDARARRVRTAVAVAASVAFAIAAHVAIVEGISAQAGAVLALVPIAFLLLALARRSLRPAAAIAALAAAGMLAWLAFPALEVNFPSLFFVEHAGGQLLLAAVFGRTLVGGSEPLVARFARMLHGELPAEVQRYCRHATIAWTAFFCTLFVLSCGLYLGGFLAAWSLLANILSPLLVGAMFVGEYFVRHRVLPDWERAGIMGGVHAFQRHVGAAQSHTR